jgi:NAD(P)H dehydrogenase (quinone)
MPAKVQIVFYSMYGHIWRLAQSIAEGAKETGADVQLFQVAETLPPEILAKMGAADAKKAWAHIPTADPHHLAEADAIILGTPTRFGAACAQMQTFLDATPGLWVKGALIGKIGAGFTSTGTQHGGQETTLMGLFTFFIHHGMLVASLPYACPELSNMSEVSGGSPYGSSTMSGPKGERMPIANELAIARFQGKHVGQLAGKLVAK